MIRILPNKVNKKATVTIYIVFFILAIIIIMISAIMAPIAVDINSRFYLAGQDILRTSNDSIQDINDATVRASVTDSINSAFNGAQNNIEINADLFRYAWLMVIGVTALTLFLIGRQIVEYSIGGGFV